MTKSNRRLAKEILGSSRGCGSRIKRVQWWNKEVKEKVDEKQEAYVAFINSRTNGEKEVTEARYKSTKKTVKQVIAMGKNIAHEKVISED